MRSTRKLQAYWLAHWTGSKTRPIPRRQQEPLLGWLSEPTDSPGCCSRLFLSPPRSRWLASVLPRCLSSAVAASLGAEDSFHEAARKGGFFFCTSKDAFEPTQRRKGAKTQGGEVATNCQGRKHRRGAMDAEISNRSLFSAVIAPLRLNRFAQFDCVFASWRLCVKSNAAALAGEWAVVPSCGA
jgi:hypothetical protein